MTRPLIGTDISRQTVVSTQLTPTIRVTKIHEMFLISNEKLCASLEKKT